jgi:hypothetical protein
MSKRAISKSLKKRVKVSKNKDPEIFRGEILSESTNPMDFGGLPERNLTKNLGCG